MDIKEILSDPNTNLSLDELDMLETELDTGDFDYRYVAECKKIIDDLRKLIKRSYIPKDKEVTPEKDFEVKKTILVSRKELLDNNVTGFTGTDEERFRKVMSYYRETQGVSKAEDLVLSLKSEELFNEEFICGKIDYFTDEEKEIIFGNIQVKEELLEKNFFSIGGELIAKTQKFSEGFYMKYFDNIPYKMINKENNEWINPKNRSQKLTVFLRLKGIIS